jgi:alkylation response protein AidB-like acyl-CoA dehydrogenase
MTTGTEAVLPLIPTDEERQIRAAVRGICDEFPEDYSRRKHAAGEPPTELWDALAGKGYLGVSVPEEWGGGGLGMSGLAAVGEEISAAGKSLLLIVVSPAIVGNILSRHGTDAQNERWLRGIAAGSTKIEEERLIGGEGGGLGPVFDGLNPERIMGASIACGAGRRALEKAAAYAGERRVWSAPIGTHQGIAHPLAEAKIELELAKLMTQKGCALYDAGAPGAGEASNMAKYAAAEAAIRCVDRAIQTHGGNGFALEYGLSDMWWGVRLTRTAPVSREMILNYVAEHSLGLPKSY